MKGIKVIVTSFNMTGSSLIKGVNIPVLETKSSPELSVMTSTLDNMPMAITAIIGPAEAKPTSPKLSSSDVLPPFTEDTPKPRASMKGTVIEPVVAPPASKAIPKNAGEENMDNISISPYIIVKSLDKVILKIIELYSK